MKITEDEKTFMREQERKTVLDFVTITLGRMGFRYTEFQDFRKTLDQVYQDYANLIMKVKQDDPQLMEVFVTIDSEILLYCGKELFEPYNQRHGILTAQKDQQDLTEYEAEKKKLLEKYKDHPAKKFAKKLKRLAEKYNV